MTGDAADRVGGLLATAADKYADRFGLRALIQIIPYVGGALDALVGGYGAKIQQERLRHFLGELKARLEGVEGLAKQDPSEELFDLMVNSFDAVIRTRSERKRAHFASIVVNQVREEKPWEEADAAVRLLADLSELHVEILKEAARSPVCGPPFEGLRVVSLSSNAPGEEGHTRPRVLGTVFPNCSAALLRMVCAELVARGLLQDEGIGRYDTAAMQYFVPTELADWFLGWIVDVADSV